MSYCYLINTSKNSITLLKLKDIFNNEKITYHRKVNF